MRRQLVGRHGSTGAQGHAGAPDSPASQALRDLAGRRAPEVTREPGASLDGGDRWKRRAGDPR
jgi:hypothetical protein